MMPCLSPTPPTIQRPRRGAAPRAAALLAAWLACAGSPGPAQPPQPAVKSDGEKAGVQADFKWLRGSASAVLVLEPPPLKGVRRWAIDSPRHRGAIHVLAVAPDGARAATGGADGVIRIWNLETGSLEKALVAHSFHIYKMAWSPDGRLLASHGWGDQTTRLWEVATGKEMRAMKSIGVLMTLAFSPDSRQLAAGNYGSGQLFLAPGLDDYQQVTELGTTISLIEWCPDGQRLAVLAGDNPTTVVDASGGRRVFDLDHPPEERPVAIVWAPDGKTFATASAQAITIWKTEDGAQVLRVAATQPFTDVAWSPDGSRLLAATARGGEFYSAADGKPAGKHPAATRIEWAPTTDRIVSLTTTRLDVWTPDGKNVVSIDAGGTQAPIFQAGRPVITGVGQPVLTTWNPKTLARTHRLEGHGASVTATAWSADGRKFASGAADGKVILWDVAAGRQLHAVAGHKAAVMRLAWSPRGDRLASAGADRSVRLWTDDGAAGPAMEGLAAAVTALAWAPNGKQVAGGGHDGKVVIWQASSGAEERSLETPAGIASIDWASVGNTPAIACGLVNGGILVLNAATGALLARVSVEDVLRYPVESIAWMPGQQPRLLTSRFFLTQVWDVMAGDTVARQIVPGGAPSVRPTAGGSLAVARAADRTVRFWDPASGSLRGVLLEDGDSLVGILPSGDVTFDADAPPLLIAIVETEAGQQTISLDDLKKTYGWKNNGTMLKLPTKN